MLRCMMKCLTSTFFSFFFFPFLFLTVLRQMLLLLVCWLSLSEAFSTRVISGNPAPGPGGFPFITWQTALEVVNGNSLSLCGGAIVSSRFVVTAAHCLKDLDTGTLQSPDAMRLLPGRDRLNKNSASNRAVLRYWVEPSYDRSVPQSNRIDIGIIELATPFDLSLSTSSTKYVSPIPLCSGSNCFTAGSPVVVSGYGQTISGDGGSTSNTLIYADLLAVDQTMCSNKFDTNFGCTGCLPRNDICAESTPNPNTKDSCFGDSGGPLVRNFGSQVAPNWQLVGIVSSGTVPANQAPACGKPGEYGLYVSVMASSQFLNNAMNGNLNSSAVDNSCVASQSCSNITPVPPTSGWIFPPFAWQWYYILAIALGGALVFIIIIAICCCCAKKNRY